MSENNLNGNRAFTGIILVLIGGALLLKNMNFPFMPDWIFRWPMILVIIGLYIGVKSNFRSNSWIIMILLGGFFMAQELVPGLTDEAFFWPVAIMVTGIVFILRPRRKYCNNDFKKKAMDQAYNEPYNPSGFKVVPEATSADSDNVLHVSSVFSGVNRKVLSKNFQGGTISCIFGGAEIDLTQADFSGRIAIKIDQVFGGIKLKVPPDWIVQNDVTGIFHGVEEKRNPQSFAANPGKTLVLTGSNTFAGIEIRSY